MLQVQEMNRGMTSWGAGFGGGRRSSQPASSSSLGSISDRAAMASGPSNVLANQEPAEVQEVGSGKKKSKFQTFKKLFARKKRKEPSGAGADAGLKASQSSDNVSKASENNTLTRSEKDKGSGSKISLGSKALSHDSVFVSDSSEANETLGASQDSIHGKVKSLQLQLKQAIRLGSPPSLMCMKGREDAGAMSEDDGLPCSPPEYTNHDTVTSQPQRNSSISLDREDDQLSCAASSRAVSPLVVPGDFSQPASPFGCLDNSAAKHKMGLRHKACNKRKPANRLEMKAEADSVDEVLNTSVTDALVEHEQLKTEDVSLDELKLKVEMGDEEEEEEEHPTLSLSKDEEGEEESEAEPDVSHGPDAPTCPQPSLSEEDVSDSHPQPSSTSCSTASSVNSLSATPEPPAGYKEYLSDPPGVAYGAENGDENDLGFSDEEDEDRGTGEEEEEEGESSFLQEVLSSLKTPLPSCSLSTEAEGGVGKTEPEVKEENREETEIEEGEEMKEEEEEEVAIEETDGYQSSPSGFGLLCHTTEEEEDTATVSCQEEVAPGEELEEEQAEEEDVLVEQLSQQGVEEEEDKEEVGENDALVRRTHIQEEEADEDYQSEGEEEAIELEKEPEVEEEGREKTEEPDEAEGQEGKERVEEAEEAIEEEKDDAEEMTERFAGITDDHAQIAVPLQETDVKVDVALGEEAAVASKLRDKEDVPAEVGDERLTVVNESQNPGYERDGGEETEEEEEAGEIERSERQTDAEEANQEAAGQHGEQTSRLDGDEVENDRTGVEEQVSSLSLSESHNDAGAQESKTSAPSKTSTTTIHINLVSPSSEKPRAFFPSPPPGAAAEQDAAFAEEGKPSNVEEEATPAGLEEETVNRAPDAPDQSKVRFSVAPAWQRTTALTPPSSPAATAPDAKWEEAAGVTDPAEAEAEAAQGPGTGQSDTAASPCAVKPQAVANTDGSSDVAKGNNPFGIRLRKTSALRRFGSEEENAEAQPSSCKVEPPHPVGAKPALPKKPDLHRDGGGKTKSVSDPAAGSGGPDSPSWISVAKQKQKIYKDNSLEEISLKKVEPERKSSLPAYVTSAANGEQSNTTADSSSAVSLLGISKPSSPAEAEARGAAVSPSPVPFKSPASSLLPSPVPPKPQFPPAAVKPPPVQPGAAPRPLSPPTPVPVYQKPPSCTSPPSLSKATPSLPLLKTAQPQGATVTSPPASSRAALESTASRAPGIPGHAPPAPRSPPAPALPQDEPPWMALAKKKAKAWSEMPQSVQ